MPPNKGAGPKTQSSTNVKAPPTKLIEVEYASNEDALNRPVEKLMSPAEVAVARSLFVATKNQIMTTTTTTTTTQKDNVVMDVEHPSRPAQSSLAQPSPSPPPPPPRMNSVAKVAGTNSLGEDGADGGSDKENLSFRYKVDSILERSESDRSIAQIISWDSGSKSFQVHNETQFESCIMKVYFKEMDGRFNIFERHLLSDGFERVNGKPNCYRHRRDQCNQIESSEETQEKKKPAVENDEEKTNDDEMNISNFATVKANASSSSSNNSSKQKKSKTIDNGVNEKEKPNYSDDVYNETNAEDAEVSSLKLNSSPRKKKNVSKKKPPPPNPDDDMIVIDDDNIFYETNAGVASLKPKESGRKKKAASKKKAPAENHKDYGYDNRINLEVPKKTKAAGTHKRRSTGSKNSQRDGVGGGGGIEEDRKKLPFPLKIWDMLNDSEDNGWTESISWSDDGMSFRIQDTEQFPNTIVPAFYENPIKFKTVIRYLEKHGFKNVKGEVKGVYSHPLFTREDRERCRDIYNLDAKPREKKNREKVGKKQTPRPRKRTEFYAPTGADDVTVTVRRVGKSRYEAVGHPSLSSTSRPQRKAKEAGRTSVRLSLAQEARGAWEFTDNDDYDDYDSYAADVRVEDVEDVNMGGNGRRRKKEAAFARPPDGGHLHGSPRGGLVMSLQANPISTSEGQKPSGAKKKPRKNRESSGPVEMTKRRKKKREERREDSASETLPTKRFRRSTQDVNYNDDGGTGQAVVDLDAEPLPNNEPIQEPFEVLDDPHEYYIEEEAHLYHNPPLPSKKTVGVMPKDLKPIPPPPPIPSNFPNTGECTWHFDEETRVLLAKFNSSSMHKDDEKFFLRMLERDDITVVSEGLADFSKLDASLWDRAYWSTVMGHEFFHKFRRFDTVKKGDEGAKCVEVDTLYSMRMRDYMKYLCLRNKFLEENPDYDFSDDGTPDGRKAAIPKVADINGGGKPAAVDDSNSGDYRVLNGNKDSSTLQDADPYSISADQSKLPPSSEDDKSSGPMVIEGGSTEGSHNGLAGSTPEDPNSLGNDAPIAKPSPVAEPIDLDDDTDGPYFTFYDHENRPHSVHVGKSCLYMIDLDVNRYLPSVYTNFMESFGCHKVLPGGEHCMMNSITSNARPFMGPNVYITPPAAFTHFHQDGHGTVDSGHLVITGYNEVVMLRRLTERHKKHALWLLTGDRSNEKSSAPAFFDGLYSEPHGDGLGEKPSWPTYDRIDACKKMGYCPSVLILKPSQLVHINKGRLHAFRKMATTKLPEADCHSKMRASLVKERQLKGEILCISVAWDWMFRGATDAGINREICTVIEAAILNRKKARVSLAIPETSLLQMATKFVPIDFKKLPRQDYCSFIQNNPNEKESGDCRDPDESAKIEKCRGILPGLRYVSKRHIDAMESAKNKSRLMGKGERVTVMRKPNTQENPLHFPVDPYGNSDFFCKLCQKELSNVYYHCDGCETLLSKDLNICRECHAEAKSMRLIQIHPLNPKRHSLVNHLGNPKFDRNSRCPCKNGPVCKHCGFCGGCSCRCHTWFTLHSRFFGKEGEAALVQRVEDAVAAHRSDDSDSNAYFSRYLNDPDFVEDRFARAEKDYES